MYNRRSFIGSLIAVACAPFAPRVMAAVGKPAAPVAFDPKKLLWGTYGLGGIHPMRIVELGDCETSHLQNILRTESWHLNDLYRDGICQILRERQVEPIAYELRCNTYEQRMRLEYSEAA